MRGSTRRAGETPLLQVLSTRALALQSTLIGTRIGRDVDARRTAHGLRPAQYRDHHDAGVAGHGHSADGRRVSWSSHLEIASSGRSRSRVSELAGARRPPCRIHRRQTCLRAGQWLAVRKSHHPTAYLTGLAGTSIPHDRGPCFGGRRAADRVATACGDCRDGEHDSDCSLNAQHEQLGSRFSVRDKISKTGRSSYRALDRRPETRRGRVSRVTVEHPPARFRREPETIIVNSVCMLVRLRARVAWSCPKLILRRLATWFKGDGFSPWRLSPSSRAAAEAIQRESVVGAAGEEEAAAEVARARVSASRCRTIRSHRTVRRCLSTPPSRGHGPPARCFTT